MPVGRHPMRCAGQQDPPRAAAERVAVFGRGRVCAQGSCATVLSAYNPSSYCWVHESRALRDREKKQRKVGVAVTKRCAWDECGRAFESANPARIYCSDRCRMAAFQRRRTQHASVAAHVGGRPLQESA
jgi:endogenous inhibitor of DNA gyrase (YacG/DUF329 family)